MRIVVISDTHIPKRAKKLPKILKEDLVKADLIIHAGDWQTLDVYKALQGYGDVVGVYGNVDGEELTMHFQEKVLLEIEGFAIGVVHGHGSKLTTEKRALKAFEDESVDVIIFGHSHIPVYKKVNDVILFNPGSPTDKRWQPQYSYGIMEITTKLEINHVYFNKDVF